MKFVAVILAATLAIPAMAADAPDKLTVEQVLLISQALPHLACGNKVIHDGAKETMICDPYKLTPGVTWLIAGITRKAAEVATQYARVRNQAIAVLARKPDGNPTDEAAAKFQLDDRAWLDAEAGVKLDHLKRSDIEPLNLAPADVAALWPIIDQ